MISVYSKKQRPLGLGGLALLVAAFAILVAPSLAQAASSTGVEVSINVDLDAADVDIDAAARFADKIELSLTKRDGGVATQAKDLDIEIYALGTSPHEADKICFKKSDGTGKVTIDRLGAESEACRKILLNGTTVFYLRASDESLFVKLKPKAPEATQTYELAKVGDLAGESIAPPGIARFIFDKASSVTAPDYDGAELTTGKIDVNSALGHLIKTRLESDTKVEFYVYVEATKSTILHELSLKRKTDGKPCKPEVAYVEDIEGSALLEACMKIDLAGTRGDARYFQMCMDMTQPETPRVVTVEVIRREKNPKEKAVDTAPDAKEYVRVARFHAGALIAGVPLYARLYHKKGTKPDLQFLGTNGFPSSVFIDAALSGTSAAASEEDDDAVKGTSEKVAECKKDELAFFDTTGPAFRDKDTVTLVGKLSEPKADKPDEFEPVREVPYVFRNVPIYRGAVRLGAALVWAPLDRKFGLRAADPTTNPGKEIFVDSGGWPQGFVGGELTLGYSHYFARRPGLGGRVPGNWTKPWFSLYVGVGLVGFGPDTATLGTSVMFGPELSFGHQWSMALTVGVRRTAYLKSAYEVGQSLPNGATDAPVTAPWMPTPQLSLVVNFSPKLFEILGNARKLAGKK